MPINTHRNFQAVNLNGVTVCFFCSFTIYNSNCLISSFSVEFLRNSTILSQNESYYDHLREFLEPSVGSDSRWLLCYRASSHGWSVTTFHSRCDGKTNTVTIIKKDEYVFGGFTDIPWGKIVVSFSLSFGSLATENFSG